MPLDDRQFHELLSQLNDENHHLRLNAVETLGASLDIRAIPFLIKVLGEFDKSDGESKVNFAATLALAHFGEAALTSLVTELHRRDPNDEHESWRRTWAAKALGEIGNHKVIYPLSRCLTYADKEVAVGAAEALARIGDVSALDALGRATVTFQPEDGRAYYAVRDAIDEIIEPQFPRCLGLNENGCRCPKVPVHGWRFCEEHSKGKSQFYLAPFEPDTLRIRVMEASGVFIPTSKRKGFQPGMNVRFSDLYYGDKFKTNEGVVFTKVPEEPVPLGEETYNAMGDDTNFLFDDDARVEFVADATGIWPHYLFQSD